jgi:hypothetical protein
MLARVSRIVCQGLIPISFLYATDKNVSSLLRAVFQKRCVAYFFEIGMTPEFVSRNSLALFYRTPMPRPSEDVRRHLDELLAQSEIVLAMSPRQRLSDFTRTGEVLRAHERTLEIPHSPQPSQLCDNKDTKSCMLRTFS